jgi:excisionase family DNA binding protein
MNAAEAAEFLGISRLTIYHWTSEKRIPFVRISARCIRFRLCDLEAWVSANTVSSQDAELPRREMKTR